MSVHRFVMRLPNNLFARLKRVAEEQQVSINERVTQAIEQSLDRKGMDMETSISHPLSATIKEIKRLLSERLSGIILFGSVARGEDTENSDIDLLIIVDSEVEVDRQLYDTLYARLDKVNFGKRYLSLNIIHLPKDFSSVDGFLLEIALSGIVLFEKEFLASRYFMQLRQLIVKGLFARETLYGHPYWISTSSERQNILLTQ